MGTDTVTVIAFYAAPAWVTIGYLLGGLMERRRERRR